MAARNIDPQKMSTKWAKNLKNSQQDMIDGINGVTDNPMAKAASRADKMKQNIVAAIDSGRWQAGLRSVDLGTWQRLTTQKIQQRLAGGVDGAAEKRAKFDSWLAGTINSGIGKIDAMPDLTLQDSIARMTAWTQYMASQKYKK